MNETAGTILCRRRRGACAGCGCGDEEFPKARLRPLTGGGEEGGRAIVIVEDGKKLVQGLALASIAGRHVASMAETYSEIRLPTNASFPRIGRKAV